MIDISSIFSENAARLHWYEVNIGSSNGLVPVLAQIYADMWRHQSLPGAMFFRWTWWRHQMEAFSALLSLCAGNSPVPVNSPHKGQWRGALMFSLIYAWINDWVNNREAGDLRRQRGHYDVIVMIVKYMMVRNTRIWQSHCKRWNSNLMLGIIFRFVTDSIGFSGFL